MLHLKPVPEKDASDIVKRLYGEIKELLEVPSVPLIFQYIGNYERYFDYLWERMRINIQADVFSDMTRDVIDFSSMTLGIIYTPTADMETFVQTLVPLERHNIETTIRMLTRLNTVLLILSIAIRESIKGIILPQKFLPSGPGKPMHDSLLTQILENQETSSNTADTKGDAMLIPLFGEDSLAVSRYPTFFSKIATEMEHLMATEAYLKTRVELEHITLLYTAALPVPLATSYREVEKYIGNELYFYDLMHLLKNIFPSIFPRLLLTSSVMQKTLSSPLK